MLPGEIFPTEVRATCHGISAATGKAGALVAGIWFNYLTNSGRFYVSAFFNLAGLLLTILFVRPFLIGSGWCCCGWKWLVHLAES